MTFILLLLIGVLTGMLAGLLGIGGGLIFTPILFYIFSQSGLGQATQWAIGSSLFCTFVASSGSVLKQYRNTNLFLPDSIKLGFAGIIGTIAGTGITLSGWYGEAQFTVIFSILLLYTSWNLFIKDTKSGKSTRHGAARELPIISALFIGIAGGIVASLAGVGGGVVLVPLMTLVLGIPFIQAVSISSGAIVVISLSAWVQMAWAQPVNQGITNLTVGFVDFGTALPLILGSFAGGYLGVKIGHLIPQKTLERIFAILLILVAIKLIYEGYLANT